MLALSTCFFDAGKAEAFGLLDASEELRKFCTGVGSGPALPCFPSKSPMFRREELADPSLLPLFPDWAALAFVAATCQDEHLPESGLRRCSHRIMLARTSERGLQSWKTEVQPPELACLI